jgi:Pyruvate/2-oxoacid:ferredoxin oxidoreductase delta subunit
MAQRSIVEIDPEKCDGCGQCVSSCAEGAIQIVQGKAQLVADIYCDGLGACLGHCPRGAITVVQREAVPFNETAAHQHVEHLQTSAVKLSHSGGCPGMAVENLLHIVPCPAAATPAAEDGAATPSALGHWPVQLSLVPPGAPFLRGADLLLVADCVPVAYADFHRRLLPGHGVLLACPKLDDPQAHVEKLAAILREGTIRSLTVVHMEVPCCTGLVRIAQAALACSGQSVPLKDVVISRRGQVMEPVTH